MCHNADAVLAVSIARPDFIATRARKVECHAAPIRAEAQPVRQAFARACELAGASAIEVHAENLSDFLAHDLDEDTVIPKQQRGRIKNSKALAGDNFGQGIRVEMIKPKMRWCLRVVFFERPSRSVASSFHAKEDDASSVGQKRTRLPGDLIRQLEIEIAQPAAIRIHQGGL